MSKASIKGVIDPEIQTRVSLTVKIRLGGGAFGQNILMQKVSATVILHSLEHAGADVLIKLSWCSGKGNFNLTTGTRIHKHSSVQNGNRVLKTEAN